MTPEEFKKTREGLGLSLNQLSKILGVETRTIRKWEDKTSLPPNPIASRVLGWMVDGFRPPEWPSELRAGKPGNPNFVKKSE
jgi:transcriptional regulator with XRE-family HTH domain